MLGRRRRRRGLVDDLFLFVIIVLERVGCWVGWTAGFEKQEAARCCQQLKAVFLALVEEVLDVHTRGAIVVLIDDTKH
jgi:hypothetical protein